MLFTIWQLSKTRSASIDPKRQGSYSRTRTTQGTQFTYFGGLVFESPKEQPGTMLLGRGVGHEGYIPAGQRHRGDQDLVGTPGRSQFLGPIYVGQGETS